MSNKLMLLAAIQSVKNYVSNPIIYRTTKAAFKMNLCRVFSHHQDENLHSYLYRCKQAIRFNCSDSCSLVSFGKILQKS
jgi:hypothetical protein